MVDIQFMESSLDRELGLFRQYNYPMLGFLWGAYKVVGSADRHPRMQNSSPVIFQSLLETRVTTKTSGRSYDYREVFVIKSVLYRIENI